jgi:CBS-domain-containing membrane protein
VRLLEQYHIGALPVIDDTGRLVGIVSEDDLLIRRAPPTAPPTPARLTRPATATGSARPPAPAPPS